MANPPPGLVIMQPSVKTTLGTWRGRVIVAGAVLFGCTGLYLWMNRSRISPPPITTDCKLVPIDVIPRDLLLTYFRRTRERYSRQWY